MKNQLSNIPGKTIYSNMIFVCSFSEPDIDGIAF